MFFYSGNAPQGCGCVYMERKVEMLVTSFCVFAVVVGWVFVYRVKIDKIRDKSFPVYCIVVVVQGINT